MTEEELAECLATLLGGEEEKEELNTADSM